MAFTIPPTIYPKYTVPADGPAGNSLTVGAAVKDMPPGSDTSMKQIYNDKVAKAKEKFEQDQAKYDQDHAAAVVRAKDAQELIGDARTKKMLAITALVTTIVAAVGILIASAITMTLPIAIASVPFFIGIIPASYYTHTYRTKVQELADDISLPKRLRKPVLEQHTYNPREDLDLAETRTDVQNRLAGKSLSELAHSHHPETLTRYALLDRVTRISAAKRPAFYAKCIQLIQAYGAVESEHSSYKELAKREKKTLVENLDKWKRSQDSYIRTNEWNLENNEYANARAQCHMTHQKPYRQVVTTVNAVSNMLTRAEIDRQKRDVERQYGARDAEIQNWYKNTNKEIDDRYTEAVAQLETQFNSAKERAA